MAGGTTNGRLAWTAGALGSTAFFGVASYLSAKTSYGSSRGDPGFFELCSWAFSGSDPTALGAAAIAGLSALASGVQLFGPKPVTQAQLKTDSRKTREGLEHLSRQVNAEGDLRREDHAEMLAAVTADRSGFTPADIRQHRISEGQALELGKAVVAFLRETRPELAAELIQSAGGAVERAAESVDSRKREVAALAAEGRFSEAGKLQLSIATEQEPPSAEEYRDAGRILVLTDIMTAISAFGRASMIEPNDFGTWIELARLHRLAGSLSAMRFCAERALACAQDDIERSIASNDLGNAALVAGDLEGAKRHFGAYLAAVEQAAERDPGGRWKRDLGVMHEKLGEVAFTAGDMATARAEFSASLAIRQALAPPGTDDAMLLRDLSVSHEKLADVFFLEEDFEPAKSHFRASLAIREAMAEQAPENAGSQRDLSVSYNKLGDVAAREGDLEEARRSYEAALAIRERLVRREPKVGQWLRDLLFSRGRVANIAVVQGRLDEARQAYASISAVRDKLAASEPDVVNLQHEALIAHCKLAQISVLQGDLRSAHAHFQRLEERAAALVERWPDNSALVNVLNEIRANLAILRGEGGV